MLDLVLDALKELRSPFALYETDIHQMVAKRLSNAELPFIHEAKLGPGCRIDYLVETIGIEIKKGKPDLNIIFVYNMPFRAIGKMAGGMVSQEMCEALVSFINGNGGLGRFIGGFFRQRKRNKRADAIR